MNKIALDTNVLIYLHEEPKAARYAIAENLIKLRPVISSQVVSEYLNVLKRLVKAPKIQLVEYCILLLENCKLATVNVETISLAKNLISKYDFQIFDAIIVAAAIEAGCDMLYSEDMHNGLLVENKLRIINPFI